MNNHLMIFENPEFGAVRSILIDGDPWFVGKDVASSLGYSNHRKALLDHVDVEDKLDGVTIRDPIGRGQKPIFISESGLYSLILSSKLERAKKFKRWVTAEVLPSIRKHGAYMTDALLMGRTHRLGRSGTVRQWESFSLTRAYAQKRSLIFGCACKQR